MERHEKNAKLLKKKEVQIKFGSTILNKKADNSSNINPVLVIVGPTASGKTDVALALAQQIGAEIISADSRQLYKNMNIGTAKPTAEELASVPHHFVDCLPLDAEYSAGQFSREARACIAAKQKENTDIVVAGGSGMYITALLDGFFDQVVGDKKLQADLKKRINEEGCEALYSELERIDPKRAAAITPADAHRIVRALEVYYVSGQRISELQERPRIPVSFPFLIFGLNWERQALYRRIEDRVDRMMEAGFEQEVQAIVESGFEPDTNALLTVGYREMCQFLAGTMSRDLMLSKIKQHTRNYAKRQFTWFRRDKRVQWLDIEHLGVDETVQSILRARAL